MLTRIFLGLCLIFTSARGAEEARTALVIGNWEYQHVGKLPHIDNDTEDMIKALKSVGFEVVHITNGTQKNIVAAIQKFGQILKDKKGVGLIYYSGHGIQADGVNYMVPVDLKLTEEDNLKYDAVAVDRILDKMTAASNGLNIIILDACRNNPFAKSTGGAPRDGLAKLLAPKGTIVAYATDPGATASAGKGRNSVYTKYLLEAIKKPNIPVEEVFKEVLRGVAEETKDKQIPWISTSFTGNFYFSGKPQASTAAVAPADQSLWRLVEASNVPDDFKEFLKNYPDSSYAPAAKMKLTQLTRGDTKPDATDTLSGDALFEQADALFKEDKMDEAAKLFLRAAQKGSAKAQFQVGELFRSGKVFDQNDVEAMKWFVRAADGGNLDGIYWIARMYEDGKGVEKDHKKAAEWLMRGAAKGDSWSQYLLATYYFSGLGVDRDVTASTKYFQQAATQGHAMAQLKLGDAYYYGRGVEKDLAQAAKWYTQSAEKGNANAQYYLGLMYAAGKGGLEKSPAEAAKWYEKVVAQGKESGSFKDAAFNLALLYTDGAGVDRDVDRALDLYTKAGEAGSGSAFFNMGVIYDDGVPGVEPNKKKAVEYYLKAVKLKHPGATLNVGVMYRTGKGMPQSDEKAATWYEMAADYGSATAARNLSKLYEAGIGVPKDPEKAAYWAKRATSDESQGA